MHIHFNNQRLPLTSPLTLAEFVTEIAGSQGANGSPFAIAINQKFIPKQCYGSTTLNDGDRVELVAPMQGG